VHAVVHTSCKLGFVIIRSVVRVRVAWTTVKLLESLLEKQALGRVGYVQEVGHAHLEHTSRQAHGHGNQAHHPPNPSYHVPSVVHDVHLFVLVIITMVGNGKHGLDSNPLNGKQLCPLFASPFLCDEFDKLLLLCINHIVYQGKRPREQPWG
jgi:hypothetical protein